MDGDRDVRQWRVRSALWQQDWEQVIAAVDGLTGEEQAEEDWQYWRARALEALGRHDEAQVFYGLASQQRSFYGFLAASRVSLPPNIVSEPLEISDAERQSVEDSPPMRRIRELNKLGMTVEARREWRDALGRMDGRSLRVAAKMAHDLGWHDQAILALGRTKYLNDLEVRFPTPFLDQVQNHAEKHNLDPAFVYAVMRQESAFGVQARSHVGALGLMQLMPATAKRTARSIKERAPSPAELLTAEKNIRLGTAYLSELLEQYRGNRFFTLAAYNAGPGRVTRWQPHAEPVPADIWVANVTFAETREYIERILAYTAVYEWRLGRSVTPVSDWLADAPPRFIRSASSAEPKTEMARTVLPPG
jgi:soluble lytic murein transglycosylase